MPYNSAGVFTRLYSWANDKINGIYILSSRMDEEMNGFADGLSNAICRDGKTTITADLPMNNKKFTGLADGIAKTDSVNVGQVQNNSFGYWGISAGAADAYTLTPYPAINSYVATQNFTAKIHATNTTTTPYLQVSNLANPTTALIKKLDASANEIAVEIGDLIANGVYHFQRNSSNSAWIVLNPQKPFVNLVNANSYPLIKASLTSRGISYLLNPIIVSNNAVSPNTKIDISAGVRNFTNGTDQAILSSTITAIIQSTGSWAAGNDQNKLDTGFRANSTWYHSYVIQNNTSSAFDVLFSTSATSPIVPSGWTNVAKIRNGQVMTDGSGNLRIFLKFANGFTKYTASANGYAQDYSGTPAVQSNTLQSIMVPNQANIGAIVKAFSETGVGGGDTMSFTYDGSVVTTTNLTVNLNELDGYSIGDSGRHAVREKLCITNSAQIKFTVYASSITRALSFATLGYYDLNF